MDLKNIILDEEKQNWATKNRFASWKQFSVGARSGNYTLAKSDVWEKAIERLDKVMRWASLNGWVYQLPISAEEYWRDRVWLHAEKYKNDMRVGLITDAELYELFKQQNDDKNRN